MQTLRLFCDVARLRSFSQAAAGHGITQSAASQRIGQLERKLDVKLLDRSVRPLGLTPAGELFLREVRELIRRYDQLEQRLREIDTEPEGHVRVAAIYSAGIGLLNHLKERFEACYGRISVTLEYKAPQEVFDAVVADECDLGIVSYPQRWSAVEQIPLRDEVMAVVCSPQHALAGRPRVEARELSAHAMAAFEPDLPVARRIRDYLKANGVRPKITHTFDNIDTIRNAVEVTGLVAILPKRTVLREVTAGRLMAVDLEPQLVRPIGIIMRKRRRGRAGNGNGAGDNGRGNGNGRDSHKDAATAKNGSSGNGVTALPPAARLFIDFLIEHAGQNQDLLDDIEARGRQMLGGNV